VSRVECKSTKNAVRKAVKLSVCIVLIYLLYIAKDLAKKNEYDHGGAARRASSGMAFVIETKSSPPHVRDGLIEGPVEGLYIIH
jgi:hypothetical protein